MKDSIFNMTHLVKVRNAKIDPKIYHIKTFFSFLYNISPITIAKTGKKIKPVPKGEIHE